MKLRIAFLFIVFVTAGCMNQSAPRLIWNDEFNYSGKPDSTKWNYDIGGHGWGNNELQYYTNDSKNVRVENGNLILEARKDSFENSAYTSTRLVSKKKGDWLYGKIEVRAKLPKGTGTWPAIWMLPTEWKYGDWPSSGEIDIMEHVGFDPEVVHGTIHTEAYNHIKQTQKEGIVTVPGAQDDFHTYAVEWRENKMDFYVDNKLYHTVNREPKDDYKGWPFDQKFHLLMNLAVGGGWGGQKGIDESIWPQRLEIDYVRVYE